MKKWIEAIKKCYDTNNSNTENQRDFTILDGGTNNPTELFSSNNMIALTWSNRNKNYIIAAGKVEPAEDYILQDKLSDYIEKFLKDEEVGLYAARDLIIDDLKGLEVCGGVNFEKDDESVFYALYLSDDVEGYLIVGFGEDEPEIVFDELCGAARTFYRGMQPAVFFNGKVDNELFNSIRHISSVTRPQKNIDWDIANITFQIDDGKIINSASIIVISKDGVTTLDNEDIFNDKDINDILTPFYLHIPNIYDISGFTITNFHDGRYGVTFYPIIDDDSDHDHHHECGDNCNHHSHNHNHVDSISFNDDNVKKTINLDSNISDIKSILSNIIKEKYDEILTVLTFNDDFFTLEVFYLDNGNFIQLAIDRDMDGVSDINEFIDDKIEGLCSKILDFSQDINGISILIDSNGNYNYQFHKFDKYIDIIEDDDKLLQPISKLFYEEINNSNNNVSAITFKIFMGKNGFFVIEPAITHSFYENNSIVSFEDNLSEIYGYIEKIFEHYDKDSLYNVIKITIIPNEKIGITFEEVYEQDLITRENIKDLFNEIKLSKYYNKISPLIKDEININSFPVDNEVSISLGLSKIGGNPDLPKNINIPTSKNNELMNFIAQINLEETSFFDKNNLLPKKGLLSFFSNKDFTECSIIYSNEKLERKDIATISKKNSEVYNTNRINFSNAVSLPYIIEDYKDFAKTFNNEDELDVYIDTITFFSRSKIFGYPDLINNQIEKSIDDNVIMLLQVSSYKECGINFCKAATIYFFIYKDDLKNLRFDKCWIEIQYDDI